MTIKQNNVFPYENCLFPVTDLEKKLDFFSNNACLMAALVVIHCSYPVLMLIRSWTDEKKNFCQGPDTGNKTTFCLDISTVKTIRYHCVVW